jgi:hypothetical protein
MNYDLKSKILDYFIDTLDSNPKEFQKDKIKPDFIIPINKNDWNTFFQLYTASMFNHLIDKPEDNNELDFKKFVENIKTNERT